MRRAWFCGLALVVGGILAPGSRAHGGMYRGPTPATPGPTTGGPGVPGNTPLTTGGSTAPSTKWQLWWEFNKDPFINLRAAIHAAVTVTGSDEFFMGGTRAVSAVDTLKPSERDVVHTVVPALRKALRSGDRDVVSSALIALAKIGRNHPTFEILDEMRPFLASRTQEERETAALAMGITQQREALPDLIALAVDAPRGRELTRDSRVDRRTRAFACYAIGLVAHGTDRVYDKLRAAHTLREILRSEPARLLEHNVPVAAIHGLRLINPPATEQGEKLRGECLEALWRYYRASTGPAERIIQAHVPAAIARLVGRGGDVSGRYREAFARDLSGESGRRSNALVQSAALALGAICQSPEENADDADYCRALADYAREGKNELARFFCLMALAKIGGDSNRSELLVTYSRAGKGLAKPWAALALGVLAYRARQRAGSKASVDATIGRALHEDLGRLKNDEYRAAIAVALGLCGYDAAAEDMEEALVRNQQRDELAGYLCIGLALLERRRATPTIRSVVAKSIRRPDLLRQAAVALGRLGDKGVTDLLLEMLRDPGRSLARLSAVSAALGYIGDRRTIDPLVKILEDPTIAPLGRAFAAVALGGVADKEDLRWNSKIAVDVSYRAAVETLTNGATGVLDIL